MKSSEKIARMHSLFGVASGEKCKDCMHFYRIETRAGKLYRKCEVYGNSNCESTDWNASFDACGCFNKETDQRNVIRLFAPRKKEEQPIAGQISIGDLTLSESET